MDHSAIVFVLFDVASDLVDFRVKSPLASSVCNSLSLFFYLLFFSLSMSDFAKRLKCHFTIINYVICVSDIYEEPQRICVHRHKHFENSYDFAS